MIDKTPVGPRSGLKGITTLLEWAARHPGKTIAIVNLVDLINKATVT